MMHLSRLSEELILWSSKEFDFIQISDLYSTGSSIMPQRKTRMPPELIRNWKGIWRLNVVINCIEGIPLAYNKDMQER